MRLLALLLFLRASIPSPPTFEGATSTGCDIFKLKEDQHWYVTVWVQFPTKQPWTDDNGRWKRHNFSIRDPKDDSKAFADCRQWRRAIEEQVKHGNLK